jgi:tRNA pseudouridine13 synthase
MIESYLSKRPGIGGSIKDEPEDFVVEEISSDGKVFEIDKKVEFPGTGGRFTNFVLQKRNWSTAKALREIAKRIGISQKRFSQAGTKDRRAVTTQLCSAFNIQKEKLLGIRIKDIQLNGVWGAADKVRLGDLLGNRFRIKVNGTLSGSEERVEEIMSELEGCFPNYFGPQRFGSGRKNTHKIGLHIIRNRFDLATEEFLCQTDGENDPESRSAREELANSWDYKEALKYFPKKMSLERSVIAHLAEHPNDHGNALRKLPRTILLLFVHAYQSYLFNRMLSDRINEGELHEEEGEFHCSESMGFPDLNKKDPEGKWIAGKIIGYETKLNEREELLLAEEGIGVEKFRIPHMPEIGSKGTHRILLCPLKGFSFNDNVFGFELPSGCYATSALREFLDIEKVENQREKKK